MSEKINIPLIRFKGFTNHWEQRKLREILSLIKDGTHGTHLDVENGPLLLSAKNIKNGKVSWDDTDRRISQKDYEAIHSNFTLHKDDILLTIVGSIGETAILQDINGITFQRSVAYLRPIQSIKPQFLYSQIQTTKFRKELDDRKSTSAQPGIYLGDLSIIPVTYPANTEEQIRIGSYFESLDNLITLHQHKHDELVKVKESMLVKMFPKKGSRVPEIRFAGFTGDWEQRKFCDLGSVAMCKRIFKEQTTGDGDVPFYKIGTFGGVADAYISRELFEEYKLRFPYSKIGDMLISASGTIGRTVEYTGKDEYFQDSNIVWFKHDERMDNSFLRCLYSIVKWSGIEGSTIKRLYNDIFLKTEFMLPPVEEQQQIGQYFRNLDNLITLHQSELDKLKNIKSAMLEKMFV